MSSAFYILFSPLLLLIAFPLVILATITTTLAFATLSIRVLIIYAELATALLRDNIAFYVPDSKTQEKRSALKEKAPNRRKSRRSSAASGSSNGGSMTPKAPDTSGFGLYGGGGPARDFEGVGGWRIPGTDGEDELWTSINSR